ncbi:MAG: hypothetical protein NW206_04435 [Hyphomonadaceae bacterium]|nr:hypothetical protein [Hyphomonadaceae bacterium]
MRPVAHIGLHAASRAYTPLIVLFGAMLAATYPPGSGVGLVAGLGFGALLLLHVIAYGATASRTALPPMIARGGLGLGLVLCLAASGAPRLPFAGQVGEVGLFLTTAFALALGLVVLVGRAPSLRDEDW